MLALIISHGAYFLFLFIVLDIFLNDGCENDCDDTIIDEYDNKVLLLLDTIFVCMKCLFPL